MITSGAAVTLVITEFNLDIAQTETVDDIRYAIGEADAAVVKIDAIDFSVILSRHTPPVWSGVFCG